MLPKNILVALLGATAAVEASVVALDSSAGNRLARRQGGRGGRFGGRFGGFNGGNNQNQDQQNQDQNNQDQQNQDQQNQDQNNQDQQNQDQNNQDQNNQDQNNQDQNNQNQDNGANNGGNAAADNQLCLNPDNVQEGSQQDGQQNGGDPAQAPSLTDDANFINFCDGKTKTNGLQVQGGSCNGIPMGDIPSKGNMVSSVFLSPSNGQNIAENTDFTITVFTIGLNAGSFTEPQSTYYAAPQQVGGNGDIIGHTHVVVQDIGGSDNPQQPLDPTQFAFFKGINDDGDGQGRLSATVPGGLPASNYRVCSMTAASNHQPVLMPVAQRGAQDDCIRFTVGNVGGGGGNGGDNNNNGGNNGGNGDNNNNNNSGSDDGNGDAGNGDAQDANQGDDQNNGDQEQANQGGGGGGNGGASAANALGGIAAPEVTDSGNSQRPFAVNGNTFVNKSAAVERACAIQNNACADAVNTQQLNGVSVGDCGNQVSACTAELS